MPTTTSNVGAFDSSVYTALNEQAAQYMREDAQIAWIPQAVQAPLHAMNYIKPLYGASVNVRGAHQLGLPDVKMETPQDKRSYNLEYVYGDIFYDVNDMLVEGKYLPQRKAGEQLTWIDQVKQSIFKGVFTGGFSSTGAGQGVRLNDGIIEQATLVVDLDGADSQLAAAGNVYLALDKMLRSIPFRYRNKNKIIVGCDDLFAFNARKALFRGSTNQKSELDLWFEEHSNEIWVLPGHQVEPKPIVSNDLFLNLVAGTTKTEADTIGTHSRLFMAAIHPDIIEQAYSFFGMMGEDVYNSIQGLNQRWAARCAGAVHRTEAVVYSERITW
jgi:hypothetical protein